MQTLDIIVIILYFVIINIIGIKFSKVNNINDYFLGNRRIHWIFACLSIVATETSSLTFLSIPGLAYYKGISFLQVALGYIIGRILVSVLLLPKYFEGKLDTVYQFLQKSFGIQARKTVSIIFHITRILADSVRLFATSIPLTMMMGWDYRISILVVGITTLFYTYYGGVKAVIITDSIQFIIYLFCAFLGIYIISDIMSLPVHSIFNMIPESYLKVFYTGLEPGSEGIFNSYNIFSGIIGGGFLSLASHGTDHLIVQRVLSCGNLKSAKKAMIASGVIVFLQFALFLLFGLFIKMLLDNKSFDKSDEIIPYFILNYLPAGLRGLMLAGIFAAAMSTLSSSINSLSASTAIDLFAIDQRDKTDIEKIKLSRLISLFWTAVMIIISILLVDSNNPLVEIGLSIASVTYGGMLGIFFMGRFLPRINDRAALAGMATGIILTALISFTTSVFWPWFVLIGFIITLVSGITIDFLLSKIR